MEVDIPCTRCGHKTLVLLSTLTHYLCKLCGSILRKTDNGQYGR
jgi:ribosomal protein S27E